MRRSYRCLADDRRGSAHNGWDTNALADETVTIGPERLIIVEGLFVSRPELSQLVDVMVLVCADTDVRWRRQLARRDAASVARAVGCGRALVLRIPPTA